MNRNLERLVLNVVIGSYQTYEQFCVLLFRLMTTIRCLKISFAVDGVFLLGLIYKTFFLFKKPVILSNIIVKG